MAIESTGRAAPPSSTKPWALRAGAFLAALVLTCGASLPASAGDDCITASEALARAQAALSKATRDVDTRADAYAQCMAGGGSCATKKAAYDTALAAKTKAMAALRTATEHRKAVCH